MLDQLGAVPPGCGRERPRQLSRDDVTVRRYEQAAQDPGREIRLTESGALRVYNLGRDALPGQRLGALPEPAHRLLLACHVKCSAAAVRDRLAADGGDPGD